VISAKGDFHGDRLFHLKSELRKDERGSSPAILRISSQANGVSLTRDENNTSYVIIRHNVRTYQSAGVVEVIKGRHNAETAVKKLEACQSPADRHEGWRYFFEKTELKAGMNPTEATKLRQEHLEDRELKEQNGTSALNNPTGPAE
jgi:hypothetical protein